MHFLEAYLPERFSWMSKLILVLRFRCSPVSRAYPLSLLMMARGESTLTDVGCCARGHSLPHSGSIAVLDCNVVLRVCSSEDVIKVVPYWSRRAEELSTNIGTTKRFTPWSDRMDDVAETGLCVCESASLCESGAYGCFFWGGGCAVLVFSPGYGRWVSRLCTCAVTTGLPLPFFCLDLPEAWYLSSRGNSGSGVWVSN